MNEKHKHNYANLTPWIVDVVIYNNMVHKSGLHPPPPCHKNSTWTLNNYNKNVLNAKLPIKNKNVFPIRPQKIKYILSNDCKISQSWECTNLLNNEFHTYYLCVVEMLMVGLRVVHNDEVTINRSDRCNVLFWKSLWRFLPHPSQ